MAAYSGIVMRTTSSTVVTPSAILLMPLRRSGLRKVMDGVTTVEEVVRETVK